MKNRGKSKFINRKKALIKAVGRMLIMHFLCIFLIIGIIGTAYAFSVNFYVKASTSDHMLTAQEAAELDADCILVLGCGVNDDGTPRLLLRDRLNCGIELYRSGAGKKLLMSGDHGRKGYDEVNAMKQYAMDSGIASYDIFMDHAGFSTYESMYRARDVFDVDKLIIVTQEYHLYRALYIARSLGLDAYGVACDPGEYHGQIWLDSRELLARNKDFIYVMFEPKPTFLGEVIPISGSGDATNDY